MIDLYEARQYLGLDTLKETGLRMPVRVYFKDPAIAESTEGAGIDDTFTTPWEPGLADGPTSARFAVVDYDSTNNVLTPPAIWSPRLNCYLAPDRKTVLDEKTKKLYQYHQLSVWAIVQNTLDFFESGAGLGRRISWAFEGNRLIIVPHAGYGENAYYDRASKSLQLYWFDGDKGRVFTCLSSDIVNHEFGHAVLDGLRPYYYESVGAQTAAFHEFMGDLTALLMAFRNNAFRKVVLKESNGKLTNAQLLAGLAHEFGRATANAPYLRTGLNSFTMKKLAGNLQPHALSEVLTGAMFDILMGVFAKHQKNEVRRAKAGGSKKPSDIRALADTVPRMQMLAIQPLDLLPPCAVTFRDYALAVLRAEHVANPTDPSGYRQLMIDCFIKRGILEEADRKPLMEPAPVFRRLALDVFHPVDSIAASRGGAYRFLDDNRAKLLIPFNADIDIPEIVRANKRTRDGLPLPEQTIVQYLWREELVLDGLRFGRFAGQRTTMLCGATIVLDPNGNLIHWARKPGSVSVGTSKAAQAEQVEGMRRRKELLDRLAARIAAGMIGESIGGELGMIERATPPFTVQHVDGTLRFGLAPHFSLNDDADHDGTGDQQWQISF
ncbi:serine protease [Bradyrhizobium sp. TZ2]